jgi:hypothetical protein
MKKTYLISFIIVFICSKISSQTVLLEKNVKDNAYSHSKGPNMRKFSHIYFGYEFFASNPDNEGADIIYGLSSCMNIGYRFKFKIAEFYSIGFNTNYNFQKYVMKQVAEKILPNSDLHDREKIRFNNAGIEFYNRINVGKRGNIIGKYLDIGLYCKWAFAINHFIKDKVSDDNNKAKLAITKYSNILYTKRFFYGFSARMGINRLAISAEYRLSDLFKEEYQFPELPRFSIGLELALYNK